MRSSTRPTPPFAAVEAWTVRFTRRRARSCLRSAARWAAAPQGKLSPLRAYALHVQWVIHAVGPVWDGGDRGESDLLRSAYASSLALARELGVRSMAFPAISTGAYR